MTAHTRTRQTGVTHYYLGRSATFWLNALAPRPKTAKPPCDPALITDLPRRPAQAASAAQ